MTIITEAVLNTCWLKKSILFINETFVLINDCLVMKFFLLRLLKGKINFGKINYWNKLISLELIKVPLLFRVRVLNSTPTLTAFVMRIADFAKIAVSDRKLPATPEGFR